MVEHTYKYDSGSKEFKQLPTVVRACNTLCCRFQNHLDRVVYIRCTAQRIGNTCDAVSLKAKFYKQARPDMYVQPVASAF